MSYRYPTPRSIHGSRIHNVPPDSNAASLGSHTDRVRQEMKDCGISPFATLRPESLFLPRIIYQDETLKGIVYGHDAYGSVMMVATDQRLVRLSKQPLFIDEEDLDYELVSGISYYSGLISSVILHTRVGDYRVHTFNHSSALKFISYIEERCLDTVLGPSLLWKGVP